MATTGRVVTAAAAIMVVVFASFLLDPSRMLQQFGLGLAVAVLLDALVIRCLMVPAAMSLLGPAPGGCRRQSPSGCRSWPSNARNPPSPQPVGGDSSMKTVGVTVLAVIGGLVAGLVLSEIIAIIGVLVFGTAAGLRFLPVYLALACAAAAPGDALLRRLASGTTDRGA